MSRLKPLDAVPYVARRSIVYSVLAALLLLGIARCYRDQYATVRRRYRACKVTVQRDGSFTVARVPRLSIEVVDLYFDTALDRLQAKAHDAWVSGRIDHCELLDIQQQAVSLLALRY